MTDQHLIQLDRLSQLLMFQLKTVQEHMNQVWFELEVARSDLRDLVETHKDWEEESVLKQKPHAGIF